MTEGPLKPIDSVTRTEIGTWQYFEVREVRPVDEVPLLQAAARLTSLAVNVLRSAGKEYYTMEFDPISQKNRNSRGPYIVPEGKVFVMISGQMDRRRGFGPFWDEYDRLVEEERVTQQPFQG